MRLFLVLLVMILAASVHAQIATPLSFNNYSQRSFFAGRNHFSDSLSNKKWFVSSYTGLSTGLIFYKGGHTSFFSAPVALQLNRQLNNNFYAFASVSAVPSYLNFNNAFLFSGNNKNSNGNFSTPGNFNMSTRVDLGLTYVNDAKTFSISGSIGVERSNYPVFQYNQANTATQPPVIYSKK